MKHKSRESSHCLALTLGRKRKKKNEIKKTSTKRNLLRSREKYLKYSLSSALIDFQRKILEIVINIIY